MPDIQLSNDATYRSLALSDVIGSFETHAGLKIASVGEDGDHLILGHHDEAACWAAFESIMGEPGGAEWYDLRRTQVAWANHSEGCELVDCTCEEQACGPCRTGDHEGCSVPCECAEAFDHEPPDSWPCSCECCCDEYAWWVSNVRDNGEAATWVNWSYEKSCARREVLRGSPVETAASEADRG